MTKSRQIKNTLPPQALSSAGYKGISQLCLQSTPGEEIMLLKCARTVNEKHYSRLFTSIAHHYTFKRTGQSFGWF